MNTAAKDTAQSSAGEAARLLWATAQPERRAIALGILGLTAAAAFEALGPILAKRLIDDYLLPKSFGDGSAIAALLAAILGCGLVASSVRYLQLTRMAAIARRCVLRLREDVYAHVLALPMRYFDQQITGSLVSRVTNDTESVNQLYRQALYVMLDSSIVVLAALVAMAWLDWRLMLIIALLIPAMTAVIWGYQRLSAPAVAQARALKSDINAQIAENLNGLAVLQASGALGRFQARFAAHNERHYQSRTRELAANAWLLRPALDLLNVVLMVALILGFANSQAAQGLEVGLLYAFLAYLTRVVEPLIQITLQFGQLQQALVAAARVGVLLQEPCEALPRSSRRLHQGALTWDGVRAGYGDGPDVLHPFTDTVQPGAFIGLVGHTGSGKSTLLSLLLRFYAPRGGVIRLDDQDLATLDEVHLRQDVALVPQEPQVLAASVWDNLRMGRAELSDERLVAAAKAARLHPLLEALPRGYDTGLGEGGVQLSTGQKQLLAMARALAGSPKILLLDEATANIDSATEAELGEALNALRGQVTIIAVAHRLSTIRAADAIWVLHHGHRVEAGRHADLIAKPGGVYQRLVQLQQLEEREEA
ncbi:ABC transporter ATP-binding protein [Inhella gelatinilytica]|uniref:Multidrug resistance-like ATP-binding protein MdlB n=1 Tax=Inhella gelatinilytica TaxID=2795030 RepID=A0A931IUG3_9BURK|nr:ABC transporter transmembrane domain-containing protein [Inhella gelatinilytica]MBH9552369.1 ATP-binding cassette domain-containing protein [Inhella gelatinilytica]